MDDRRRKRRGRLTTTAATGKTEDSVLLRPELVDTDPWRVLRFPIALFGSLYWSGLLDWLEDPVPAEGKVAPEEKADAQ